MRPDEPSRDTSPSTKIVIADTSPLNYLVQVNCNFLLPLLFRRVVTPPSVITELSHSGAPIVVSLWAAALPAWIEVLSMKTTPDPGLSFLGAGERDAIQLALELGISTLLIDEQQGRQEARTRGLTTTGTIGVLIAGHKAGLVDGREAFRNLTRETTFRSTAALRREFADALDTPQKDSRKQDPAG